MGINAVLDSKFDVAVDAGSTGLKPPAQQLVVQEEMERVLDPMVSKKPTEDPVLDRDECDC